MRKEGQEEGREVRWEDRVSLTFQLSLYRKQLWVFVKSFSHWGFMPSENGAHKYGSEAVMRSPNPLPFSPGPTGKEVTFPSLFN